MSFFSSILSPFKSLLSPFASAMPALGTLAGGVFGGPAGAGIGSALGNIGSSLFGRNDSGQQAQQGINQYLPPSIQNANFGNMGSALGQFGGQRLGQMAGGAMPGFMQNPRISNASLSNVGQRLGGMAGNWMARQAQNYMPSSLRGTQFGQDVPGFFRNLGNAFGGYGQQAINSMTPSFAQPYANTRFNQIPSQVGQDIGRQYFDNPMQSRMPGFLSGMQPGNVMSQLGDYGNQMAGQNFGNPPQQPQQQEPEQMGLAGMGYAHGGHVGNYANGGMYYPGGTPHWRTVGNQIFNQGMSY